MTVVMSASAMAWTAETTRNDASVEGRTNSAYMFPSFAQTTISDRIAQRTRSFELAL